MAFAENPVSRDLPPNDWKQIQELVDAVLDAAPDRRPDLIAELAGDDVAKRAELERLVAECERAIPLLERPAAERFAALLQDPTPQLPEILAERYRLTRELGRGGMATVYLAQDIKHGRMVAVKVLRPELAALLGTERFLSEIRVTASLQHPHLLPLFDSGEAGGMLFYVMPYVEGESLRERLERERQLPLEDAMRIAVGVTSALDYAHRHRVIHRDLKPENILLQDGEPLVADFGIALAISHAGGTRLTETGLTLGTPRYMSPEQAAGDRALDARSDIYSFAAVLYEMLAGEPPHTGSTAQAIIAKALSETVRPVRGVRNTVPEHVDAALLKALATVPADRFATAAEFGEALTGVRAVITPARVSTPPAGPREVSTSSGQQRALSRWLPWIVAAAGIGGTVMLARAGWFRSTSSASPMRLEVVLPDSAPLAAEDEGGNRIAFSPDGSQLAYVAQSRASRSLYLRRLDDANTQPIPGTEGANAPHFSWDGSSILFTAEGKLKKVPLTGGLPLVVADSARDFAVGEGNVVVFTRNGTLWRVSADGGVPQLLARPDSSRGHVWYYQPEVLPGGHAAFVTIYKGSTAISAQQLGIVALPGGKITELGIPGANARYVPTGHILFSRGETVMAARFSLGSLRALSVPTAVLEDAVHSRWWSTDMDIAPNGTLAYLSAVRPGRRLIRLDRRGSVSAVLGDSRDIDSPRLSPDGQRVAMTIIDSRGHDIWIFTIGSRTLARLTNNGISRRAVWFDGGRRVAYHGFDDGRFVIKQSLADGSGTPEVFLRTDATINSVSVGPPKSFVVVQQSGDLLVAPLDSPRAIRKFVATLAAEYLPRVSPSGRLLAYVSDETGRAEVYITRLPGPKGRVIVSTGGGTEPVWSSTGEELFYRGSTHLISARIKESPELAVSRRDTLFEDRYARSEGYHAQYDVFPSGKEFLMVRPDSTSATRFVVVVNWFEELRRRTSVK